MLRYTRQHSFSCSDRWNDWRGFFLFNLTRMQPIYLGWDGVHFFFRFSRLLSARRLRVASSPSPSAQACPNTKEENPSERVDWFGAVGASVRPLRAPLFLCRSRSFSHFCFVVDNGEDRQYIPPTFFAFLPFSVGQCHISSYSRAYRRGEQPGPLPFLPFFISLLPFPRCRQPAKDRLSPPRKACLQPIGGLPLFLLRDLSLEECE